MYEVNIVFYIENGSNLLLHYNQSGKNSENDICILYNKLLYNTSGVLDSKSIQIGQTRKETKRVDFITQPSF